MRSGRVGRYAKWKHKCRISSCGGCIRNLSPCLEIMVLCFPSFKVWKRSSLRIPRPGSHYNLHEYAEPGGKLHLRLLGIYSRYVTNVHPAAFFFNDPVPVVHLCLKIVWGRPPRRPVWINLHVASTTSFEIRDFIMESVSATSSHLSYGPGAPAPTHISVPFNDNCASLQKLHSKTLIFSLTVRMGP